MLTPRARPRAANLRAHAGTSHSEFAVMAWEPAVLQPGALTAAATRKEYVIQNRLIGAVIAPREAHDLALHIGGTARVLPDLLPHST
jgi:hypothetical protein